MKGPSSCTVMWDAPIPKTVYHSLVNIQEIWMESFKILVAQRYSQGKTSIKDYKLRNLKIYFKTTFWYDNFGFSNKRGTVVTAIVKKNNIY